MHEDISVYGVSQWKCDASQYKCETDVLVLDHVGTSEQQKGVQRVGRCHGENRGGERGDARGRGSETRGVVSAGGCVQPCTCWRYNSCWKTEIRMSRRVQVALTHQILPALLDTCTSS